MAAPPRKYSPEDGRRLTILYKVDRCLFALADQLKQPIHDILSWASLPHIKEAIELIERNEFAGVRAIVI